MKDQTGTSDDDASVGHSSSQGSCTYAVISSGVAENPDDHDVEAVSDTYGGAPKCLTCPEVSLQADNGDWLGATGAGGSDMYASGGGAGYYETFRLIDLGDGYVALQAQDGHYLCAENGGGQEVVADRTGIGPWETFLLIDLGSGNIALQAYNEE